MLLGLRSLVFLVVVASLTLLKVTVTSPSVFKPRAFLPRAAAHSRNPASVPYLFRPFSPHLAPHCLLCALLGGVLWNRSRESHIFMMMRFCTQQPKVKVWLFLHEVVTTGTCAMPPLCLFIQDHFARHQAMKMSEPSELSPQLQRMTPTNRSEMRFPWLVTPVSFPLPGAPQRQPPDRRHRKQNADGWQPSAGG